MLKSIMKKSVLALLAFTMCFFLSSASAYAADNEMKLTVPPGQSASPITNPIPDDAIVFDNGNGEVMYVGYVFTGKAPLNYYYNIKEVNSSGTWVPGFSYFSGVININSNANHPTYAAGGSLDEVSTSGMLRGHMYSIQLQANYLNGSTTTSTNDYAYFYLP